MSTPAPAAAATEVPVPRLKKVPLVVASCDSLASDQNMSKRRDLGRKRDLRTDQKGMNARARSIQSAILAAEVADSAEKGYRLVLERQIPSVQVHLLWNRRRSAAIGRTRCSWTERSELPDLNRGT